MATVRGGCDCGAVRLAFDTARAPDSLSPRACDCSFCRKHGAAWVSDADGTLVVTASPRDALHDYRQGSGHARFLLCARCGVLVAVVHAAGDALRGAMNAGCVDGDVAFAARATVSPRTLSADEKATRWQQLWTPARVEAA